MKKTSFNLHHMLLMASVIDCLSFAVATKAEKVTGPVPDSAHMANDLREKLRSGNTGNTPEEMLGTVKRIAECGSGRVNDVCLVFYKKHANLFVNADYETLPDEYARHPDRLTTYPPALALLQEHFRRSPKITSINIIELSLEPLDYPRQPVRGSDTAVDGILGNHGPAHQ